MFKSIILFAQEDYDLDYDLDLELVQFIRQPVGNMFYLHIYNIKNYQRIIE